MGVAGEWGAGGDHRDKGWQGREGWAVRRAESSSKGEPGKGVGNVLETEEFISRRVWQAPQAADFAARSHESSALGVPGILELSDSTLSKEPAGGAGQAEGATEGRRQSQSFGRGEMGWERAGGRVLPPRADRGSGSWRRPLTAPPTPHSRLPKQQDEPRAPRPAFSPTPGPCLQVTVGDTREWTASTLTRVKHPSMRVTPKRHVCTAPECAETKRPACGGRQNSSHRRQGLSVPCTAPLLPDGDGSQVAITMSTPGGGQPPPAGSCPG